MDNIEEFINLDNKYLLSQRFNTNFNNVYKYHDLEKIEIENNINLDSSLGINEEKTELAYKTRVRIVQKEPKKEKKDYISKLELEYIFIFEIKEKYSNDCISIIESGDKENKDLKKLIAEMLNSSYPYIKEHIENIYKDANIPIKMPLKLN